MAKRIKTTNVVTDETITENIRTVRCAICKTHLRGISQSTTAMICWVCGDEFRIQQDISKWEDGMNTQRVKRTLNKPGGQIEQSPGLNSSMS